jgi:transcriptional regulator with XRE-family HTH domain
MGQQSFGQHIKALRIEKGVTQKRLARQVEIDFSYLSKIEAGKVPPPSEKVIRNLAQALGADQDELLVLARKAPSDLTPIITRHARIPAILRRANGLSAREWEQVDRYIQQLKAAREGEEEESQS